jgi:hypothetical protein
MTNYKDYWAREQKETDKLQISEQLSSRIKQIKSNDNKRQLYKHYVA